MVEKTGDMLILGCGYSGRALARRLVARGWRVAGTTRSEATAAALAGEGIEPLIWPLAEPGVALDAYDHLLASASPEPEGDPVLAALGDAISARAMRFRWVGYLSTTGVYGDHGGDWVDESAPLEPATDRGRARVAAEAEWMRLHEERGLAVHLFRLAGIYGPGRGPFEKIRRGTARRVIKPGQVFSRVHVEDIATVLEASIARPNPGAAYNVCDDQPAPPQDVLTCAAELLGAPPPPEVAFEDAEMSPMARSFYAESKRVSNRRIREELGVELAYPNYRSGLRATLDAEDG